MSHLHTIRANADVAGIRREMYDGRTHLVVPAVLAVAGVLNDALVPADELARFAEAWNGRPVPVLHPERNGEPVSANAPDILQRTIGTVFNARMDGDRLRAELWIDEAKADRMGYAGLVSAMAAGETIEVSTGYFPDEVVQPGEFNGRAYAVIHRNIRPDHLALLPGQLGACSVADGCGAPRINRSIKLKLQEAFDTLRAALGIKTNCCEGNDMNDIVKRAEALVANKGLTAKQFEVLQGLDEEARAMVKALVEAMTSVGQPEAAEELPEEEELPLPEAAAAVPALNAAAIDKMVGERIDAHLRRKEVTTRLVANERCPFSAAELDAMPVAHLEKLEKSIRPADYSGQGGFATNSASPDPGYKPLTINRGVLTRKQEA